MTWRCCFVCVRRIRADDSLSDALRSNLTRLIAYAKSADPDLQRQVAEKLANEAVNRELTPAFMEDEASAVYYIYIHEIHRLWALYSGQSLLQVWCCRVPKEPSVVSIPRRQLALPGSCTAAPETLT